MQGSSQNNIKILSIFTVYLMAYNLSFDFLPSFNQIINLISLSSLSPGEKVGDVGGGGIITQEIKP